MILFKEKVILFAVKYRKYSAVLVLLLTAFFGFHLKNIKVDNNAAHAVPDTLIQLRNLEKIREKFNSPYSILLMTQFDEEKGLPLHEKIETVSSWAQRFLEIEVGGIKGFDGAAHIATLSVPMMGRFGGIRSAPIAGQKDDETLRRMISENFALAGSFISQDEKTFLLILHTSEVAERHKVISRAMEVLREIHEAGFTETYITGATATSWYMSRDMGRDLSLLLPISLFIAAALLYWMFRSVRCVFASLLLVSISAVWTFGIMSLAGIPVNVLTSVIPLILLPVGLAGSLHIIKSYRQHRNAKLPFDAAFIKAYQEVLGPVFIAALTTFFGFSSFTVSSLSWTRYFGFFTGLGVLISLLLAVFFLSACFSSKEREDLVDREPKNLIPMSFFNFVSFKWPISKILLLCVIAFSVYFVPKITFDSNPISFFNDAHDVRLSNQIIDEQFGGTRFFDIMIESDEPFADSASWQNLQDIADWMLNENPEIGSVTSVFPVLNRVSDILKSTPVSEMAVSLMLNENAESANVLSSFVTPDRRAVRMTLVCKNIPLYDYTQLAQHIENHIVTHYPQYRVTAAGEALLIDSMIDLLIKTQTYSLLITFLLIAISLVFLFKSLFLGFFSTIPIVIGACFIVGIMAAAGITINMVTVIVVNCCIGIGIDYAIHFTSAFSRFKQEGVSATEALLSALQDKSTVIVFNTLAVGVGFLALCLSNFPPVRTLGFFFFLSMAVSSMFSLLFLPVFLDKKGG